MGEESNGGRTGGKERQRRVSPTQQTPAKSVRRRAPPSSPRPAAKPQPSSAPTSPRVSPSSSVRSDIPQEWVDAAGEAARQYGLPEEILTALITQESNWDPQAVSPKGAVGLTQVLPETAAQLRPGMSPEGIATLMQDPLEQIQLGAQYLGSLRDRFGGFLPEALAVYNSGAGTRDAPRVSYFDETGQRQRVFNTPETQNYVLDIMDRARGGLDGMFTRQASPDRTSEERRSLIEQSFYGVPGATYDYESDSYIPIRPTMRPNGGS